MENDFLTKGTGDELIPFSFRDLQVKVDELVEQILPNSVGAVIARKSLKVIPALASGIVKITQGKLSGWFQAGWEVSSVILWAVFGGWKKGLIISIDPEKHTDDTAHEVMSNKSETVDSSLEVGKELELTQSFKVTE